MPLGLRLQSEESSEWRRRLQKPENEGNVVKRGGGGNLVPSVSMITSWVISAPSAWTWRPFVPVSGVRAISGEVSAVTTLVTPHGGIESSSAKSPSSWARRRHSDASSAQLHAVGLADGVLGVAAVPKDDEGEARHGSGHPNLFEGSEFAISLLQVPLGSAGVQVSDVEAVAVVPVPRGVASGSAASAAPA